MRTVLVVDDSALIRFLIKQILQPLGMKVIERDSGEQLIDLLKYQKIPVDLILLDVHMNGLSGLETISEIKKINQYRYTPIIIMTGYADHATVTKALKAGIQDFIVKPINENLLKQKVSKILELQQPSQNTVNFSTEKYIELEVKKANRSATSLSVIAITLKELKNVSADNELLPSLKSEILSELSSELVKIIRETDTVLTYNEEKLLVVLPFTDKNGLPVIQKKIENFCAEKLAEKAVYNIASVTYDGKEEKPYDVLAKLA